MSDANPWVGIAVLACLGNGAVYGTFAIPCCEAWTHRITKRTSE